MQGSLTQIDLPSVLHLLEIAQMTGELSIESNSTWSLFFVRGKIIYAQEKNDNNLLRLSDYLYSYLDKEQINSLFARSLAVDRSSEYSCLQDLWTQKKITSVQAKAIVSLIVQEVLFEIIWLRKGDFVFKSGTSYFCPLESLAITPLIRKTLKQVQLWKQFYPQIRSSSQAPRIIDRTLLKESLSEHAYKILSHWANGKTSLRELARYVHCDLASLAKGIYPYLKQGAIELIEQSSAKQTALLTGKQIVFISQKNNYDWRILAESLEQKGHRLFLFSEPIEALTKIFSLQPDVILCELIMSQLDGYDFCTMLRHSKKFKQTPMILLEEEGNFFDRERINPTTIGSTAFWHQLPTENELLMLIEKSVDRLVLA